MTSPWINWKTIATSLASLVVIGLLTTGWTKVNAEVQEYKQMKQNVQSQQQQMKQMQEQTIILRRMAEDVAGIKKTVLTVSGRAVVRDLSGACMQVNISGRASAYAKMEKARITNMSSAELPSVIVKIEGTFTHTDENNIAIISKRVGGLIDAKIGTAFNIRIEPVEEAK